MKIYYLICEDNDDYRDSLVAYLDEDSELLCCGAFARADKVLEVIKIYQPQIVLMDIDMPGKNGIEALQEIREHYPEVEVLMLTIFEDRENVFEAIRSGASGYLLKNTAPDIIAQSMKDVVNGGAPMTPTIARKILHLLHNPKNVSNTFNLTTQEQQILKFLVDGLSYKMIAVKQSVVIDTVRYHIKKIYMKLHVHSAPEAVAKAIREKLV
jgi:DNA-binding NarL/FixJ family response regulator